MSCVYGVAQYTIQINPHKVQTCRSPTGVSKRRRGLERMNMLVIDGLMNAGVWVTDHADHEGVWWWIDKCGVRSPTHPHASIRHQDSGESDGGGQRTNPSRGGRGGHDGEMCRMVIARRGWSSKVRGEAKGIG